MSDRDDFAASLESAGLLHDEYPDEMAQQSCTCASDIVCGAHKLLARYGALFDAFQEAKRERREALKALRDLRDSTDDQGHVYERSRARICLRCGWVEGSGKSCSLDVPAADATTPAEVVHQCPPAGSGVMPCCGSTPFERRTDRITIDPTLVTCVPAADTATEDPP